MHNIRYRDYEEKVNRKKVEKELNKIVAWESRYEGGGGLLTPVRWLDWEPICETDSDALELIRKRDMGWYDALAVRYYVPLEKGQRKRRVRWLVKFEYHT